MTDLYAVVGDPIAHSKSPLIHRLFAEQTNQDLVYEAIRIDSEESSFVYAVQEMIAKEYKGINITVPYKLDAFEFASELSERAKVAHAVNTFLFEDGRIIGDNTDGIGLVHDVEHNGHRPFKDQAVLIIGAGGAVQGIMQPLIDAQPANIHIANRTAKRAEVLGNRFDANFPITASGWEDIPLHNYDIIINGTSASLEGNVPPVPREIIGENSLVYDMMYGAEPTVFLKWAKECQPNCQTMDGLGMLIGQAAESFFLWRGVRPETASVIQAVREKMKS